VSDEFEAKLISVIEEWAPNILWDSEEDISSRMAETNSLFDDYNYEDIEVEKVTESEYEFSFNLVITGNPRKDDVLFCGDKIKALVNGKLVYDEDICEWIVSEYEVLGAEVEDWREEDDASFSPFWNKEFINADKLISHLSTYSRENWFRGHGDATWKLETSIARCKNRSLSLEEQLRLEYENQISFIDSVSYPLSLEKMYFLMQHHGVPTRLLDWSRSPLVGLYYAVSNSKHDDKDGCIWVLNPSQLNRHYKQNFPLKVEENHFTNNKQEIYAIHAPYTNLRMKVQQSELTLHMDYQPIEELLAASIFIKEKIVISKSIKPELREKLSALGINRSFLFPDLDNIAKTVVEDLVELK
jgi:hypothetical protein